MIDSVPMLKMGAVEQLLDIELELSGNENPA
jgi:hypothetical protein